MKRKKPTVADLMARIDALEAEVAALKAAPKVEYHTHYHTAPAPFMPLTEPSLPRWAPSTWPPQNDPFPKIYCASASPQSTGGK